MKLGIVTPVLTRLPRAHAQWEETAGIDDVARIAVEAERLGYDSVWCNDHLTTQRYVRQRWAEPPSYYDPFVALSFVAAATERVRLGTSIVVLPMREPVVVAKQASTLDVFSGGRLILGVGVGAYREEFEAWFRRAGLEDVQLSWRNENSWRGLGRKPVTARQPEPVHADSHA